MTGEVDPVVRLGVLGTGALSQIVHLPILTRRDDAEVVAVSDRDRAKAETIAERFGVARVGTHEDLLADPDIDAVVVSTPNHLHREQAVAAVRAGKHALVERPLAFTGEGVEEVIEAAEEAGRTVAVGMSHRYRPDMGALRSFVAGGELGEVYAVRCAWLNRRLPLARITWRQRPEEAGGGVLMDLGVQALDLCLWLIDYPDVARVSAAIRSLDRDVEEAASLMAVTDDGVALQVEVTSNYHADEDEHYVRVMGVEGSGSAPPLHVQKRLGGRPMDVTPRSPREAARENPFTSAYRRQHDHFIRTVSGEAEAPPPREQIRLMALVEAAYRSAEEGAEVGL